MKRKTMTIFSLGCAVLLLLPSLAIAGQLGQGGGSAYPSALDTTTTYTNKVDPCVTSISTRICKETFNDPQDAIVKIETELGLLPKGSYATVVARLNAAAYLTTANTFTANQTLSFVTPSFILTDTTASAKSLTIAVGANVVNFRESAGASGSLLVLDLVNNRVGIGTALPANKATIDTVSAVVNVAEPSRHFILRSTDAVAADLGPQMSFSGSSGGATTPYAFATIAGRKEGAAAFAGYLQFATTAGTSGVISERMRIDSTGNVGIGTTSPNVGLEMGATLDIRIPKIKSTTGARYVCVDVNGTLTSQAAACSGT